MLVVMMLMTASSAMAQEAKFEVIDGFRYLLDTGAKTAMLLPQKDVKYSGDIIIPEKVEGNSLPNPFSQQKGHCHFET